MARPAATANRLRRGARTLAMRTPLARWLFAPSVASCRGRLQIQLHTMRRRSVRRCTPHTTVQQRRSWVHLRKAPPTQTCLHKSPSVTRAAPQLFDDRLGYWHRLTCCFKLPSESAAVPFRGANTEAAVDGQVNLHVIAFLHANAAHVLGRNAQCKAIAPFCNLQVHLLRPQLIYGYVYTS